MRGRETDAAPLGIIAMLGAGVLFWITSMTMWKFIMKYVGFNSPCTQRH